MAFRGRGRGRGWFGGGGPQRPDEDFALFPNVEELPPIRDFTDEEKFCVQRKRQLEARCQTSPYFIKDKTQAHDTLAPDVERFSDTRKTKEAARHVTLLDTLILSPSNFPLELIEGKSLDRLCKLRRGKRRDASHQRKVQKDLRDMDLLLAKLKGDGQDDVDEDDEPDENKKKKKADGDEEEDDNEENDNPEVDEDEDFGADDYTQNFGFDDDDDDYLDDDNDGGEDEPTFD